MTNQAGEATVCMHACMHAMFWKRKTPSGKIFFLWFSCLLWPNMRSFNLTDSSFCEPWIKWFIVSRAHRMYLVDAILLLKTLKNRRYIVNIHARICVALSQSLISKRMPHSLDIHANPQSFAQISESPRISPIFHANRQAFTQISKGLRHSSNIHTNRQTFAQISKYSRNCGKLTQILLSRRLLNITKIRVLWLVMSLTYQTELEDFFHWTRTRRT